jgi:hypothetical protein
MDAAISVPWLQLLLLAAEADRFFPVTFLASTLPSFCLCIIFLLYFLYIWYAAC